MLQNPGVKYLGISRLRTRYGETIGYGINKTEDSGKVIGTILEYPNNEEGATPNENQTPIYCLKADVGFSNPGAIVTYDVNYDMFTDKDIIQKQNDISYQLINNGHYHKLLTLLDTIYIPSCSSEEYRKQLLDAAFEKYPVEFTTPITDNDIDAVNQTLIWYYTNYTDTRFKNFNKKDWLKYTVDGENYDSLSAYKSDTKEGEDRAKQAESLYKYLLDTVESQNLGGETVNETCIITPTESVNLREAPNTSSQIVKTISEETTVTRIKKNVAVVDGYVWDKIKLEDSTEAYIATELSDAEDSYMIDDSRNMKLVSRNETCTVSTFTQGDSVNVREEPYLDAIAQVTDGTTVTRLEKNVEQYGGYLWDKIKLEDGTEGYIATQFLEATNENEENSIFKVVTYDSGSNVFLRSAPDSYSENQIALLIDGDIVTRIEKNADWREGLKWDKVRLSDGTEGYVATQYLQPYELDTTDYDIYHKVGAPLLFDTTNKLEKDTVDSNYIIGPIKITKNNDVSATLDYTVKAGETNITDFKLLNSEKEETTKDELLKGGDFYISLSNTYDINTVSIDFDLKYDTTSMTLWASTLNNKEQLVFCPKKGLKDIKTQFNLGEEPDDPDDPDDPDGPGGAGSPSTPDDPSNPPTSVIGSESDPTLSPFPLANTGNFKMKIFLIALLSGGIILVIYLCKKNINFRDIK